MHPLLQSIVDFALITAAPLKHLGVFGYPTLFLIAFVESVIIIGSFIPGSIGIIFAGFLAHAGYYSFWWLVPFAVLGGILGDWLSFYLGGKGENFFKSEARFLKKTHLERGKIFFEKYGDKSVLIGRFTGPLRPIIPFVAGLSKMNKRVFMFWNVVSSFIWILFHMSLGYFFGTSLKAIEGWSLWAGGILLVLIGTIVAGAILIQQRERIFSFLDKKIDFILKGVLENTYLGVFLEKHPSLGTWIKARFQRHVFTGLPLTMLVISAFYLASLFEGVAEDVVSTGFFTAIDEKVLSFAINLHHPNFAKFVVWVTSLGGETVIPVVAIVSVIIFFFVKRKIFILPLIFTGALAEIFNLSGKAFFHRARPTEMLVNETSFSFPSGHATLSIAIYGFIAYVIMRTVKSESVKIWLTVFFSILITAISLSRIYLRVHYATDVLGGLILGGISLIAGIILSEYLLSKKSR